jgi:hypothetical protein
MTGRESSEYRVLAYLVGFGTVLCVAGMVLLVIAGAQAGAVPVAAGALLLASSYHSYARSRGTVKAPRPYLPPAGRL